MDVVTHTQHCYLFSNQVEKYFGLILHRISTLLLSIFLIYFVFYLFIILFFKYYFLFKIFLLVFMI